MSSAIGIVSPIVTTPHGLDASALTTTSASTAISTTIIPRIATSAVDAGDGSDLLARHLRRASDRCGAPRRGG